MIKVHEFTFGSGEKDEQLEGELNKFLGENNISEDNIINVTWRKPFVAQLIYKS